MKKSKRIAEFTAIPIEFAADVAADAEEVPGKPFLVYPMGDTVAIDDRKVRVTPAVAKGLEEWSKSQTNPLPILYEHGKDPAKGFEAAGWVPPGGLKAKPEGVVVEGHTFTRTAYEEIKKKLRRFISGSAYGEHDKQGFFSPETMREISITNVAAFTNLPPLAASSTDEEDSDMDAKLREALLDLYGLPKDADDAAITAAVAEQKEALGEIEAEEKKAADEEAKKVALAAASNDTAAKPDMKKMVQEMASELFRDHVRKQEIEEFVSSLVKAGKVTKANEKSALALASLDFDSFKTMAAAFPVTAPVKKVASGTTDGKTLVRHSADLIGDEENVDLDRLALHRAAIDYMTANKMQNHEYGKAVLAVSKR